MTRCSLGAARPGVTLAELLAVIVILGIIAGVGVHALHSPARDEVEGRMTRSLIAARAEAIKARRPVVVRIEDSSGTSVATALPDGSITSEAGIRARVHLNSLTGATLVGGDTGRARD